MQPETITTTTQAKESKVKSRNAKDKVSGKKRTFHQKENNTKSSDENDESRDYLDNISLDKDDDFSLDSLSDDEESTNNQLFKIEKKIKQPDISKRERRLLQNRKSALKCRLKKQQELDKMKKQVDKLSSENRELKEKISAMNALLLCKSEETNNLNKKYSDLQLQQTLIIASFLNQQNANTAGNQRGNNSGVGALGLSQLSQNSQSSLAATLSQSNQGQLNPLLSLPLFQQFGNNFQHNGASQTQSLLGATLIQNLLNDMHQPNSQQSTSLSGSCNSNALSNFSLLFGNQDSTEQKNLINSQSQLSQPQSQKTTSFSKGGIQKQK